jgi:threonine dehydratase
MKMPTAESVRTAVAAHARVTPLLPASELSARVGRTVLLKAECLQRTGSFKVRGAAARLSELDEEARARGVVACSSGNHGRAVSFVAQRIGIPATVFVPDWVDPVKLEGIRSSGAETRLAGATFDEAEALAIQHASEIGRVYVSAYDDPWVIAGQGTIALEILEQSPEVPAAIVVPLSGGGLIAGIASALEEHLGGEMPRCVAASAANASVMYESVREGRPVELPELETLANALAGGIGLDNRYSFPLVRDLDADHVLVDEAQIAAAMRYSLEHLSLVLEGGGAVGLAAVATGVWSPASLPIGGPIVVLLSGGNVAAETLCRILAGWPEAPTLAPTLLPDA